MTDQDLQYGEQMRVDPGKVLYKRGDPVTGPAIYYIVAGLVRLDLDLAGPERLPVLECPRLTGAYCMENSLLYRWDKDGFDLASSVSWELAFNTITGLTHLLRILNAEFGDRLGKAGGEGEKR
jgi:hypothetical protein